MVSAKDAFGPDDEILCHGQGFGVMIALHREHHHALLRLKRVSVLGAQVMLQPIESLLRFSQRL